jgi:arylformamidase
MKKLFTQALVSSFALALVAAPVVLEAGPLRDRIIAKRMEKAGGDDGIGLGELDSKVSSQISKAKTLSYGPAAAQVMDIYPQSASAKAPVIIMAHGGGWRRGSRQSEGVVDNKLKHFEAKGYVFVSTDYRMVPEADPYVQAQDVAKAIAYVQANIGQYGGDPDNIIIMGHSAGGHLVALISADPMIATGQGAKPWRGTVVLDAGALDTVANLSKKPHAKLYDTAFGSDPAFWAKVSPMERLTPQALPTLLICSTKRVDKPCGAVHKYAEKAKAMGREAGVSEQSLTHADVNANVGLPGAYTDAVDAFVTAHLKF